MREALKTNISKYGPKTDAAMTVENVQGKGLQLVVIYAGRKHYLPLSSVPMNPDTHANHPNHQKIKVDHDGKVGIGKASPSQMLNVKVSNGNDNVFVAKFENADADNPNGIYINYSGVDLTSDDTADHGYLRCNDSNNTVCEIYGDGDIVNEDNSYTSDIRIKKDIADATSKLGDLLKLKVRNYKFKKPDGSDISGKLGGNRIGFIADELETVFPNLIVKRKQKKFGIDYDDLKTIRGSALVPILVKAVQELSAKVTSLESK
jgi:hypothetical protein